MEGLSLFDSAIKKGKYWPIVESCYSKTWKNYRMPPHIHERIELMYVLKGKCLIHFFDYVEDPAQDGIRIVDRQIEKMGVSEFVLVDKGVLHALEVTDSSYMANVEFAIRPDATAVLSIAQLYAVSDAFESLLNLLDALNPEQIALFNGCHYHTSFPCGSPQSISLLRLRFPP